VGEQSDGGGESENEAEARDEMNLEALQEGISD